MGKGKGEAVKVQPVGAFAGESKIRHTEKALMVEVATAPHDVVGRSTSRSGFQSDKEVGSQNSNRDRRGRGKVSPKTPGADAFIFRSEEGGRHGKRVG